MSKYILIRKEDGFIQSILEIDGDYLLNTSQVISKKIADNLNLDFSIYNYYYDETHKGKLRIEKRVIGNNLPQEDIHI